MKRTPRSKSAAFGCLVLGLLMPFDEAAKAPQPSAAGRSEQDSVERPETAALRAVDRFVAAFNAGDVEAFTDSLAPRAAFSRYNWLVDDFRSVQERVAADFYTWMLDTDWSYEIRVLERVASGNLIFQRERLAYARPDGSEGSSDRAILYMARDGRIQSIWQLPAELRVDDLPSVESPHIRRDAAAIIAIDAAHFNHHKAELTYWPFAELLRQDGYEVRSWTEVFRRTALDDAGIDVLVIANATAEKNAEEPIGGWRLPTPPAFTEEEVANLESWVEGGGSLLLVADHLPWGGAAAGLAAAFGAEFQNGFARNGRGPPPDIFSRELGTLLPHEITDGRSSAERVDAVATFVGQAFRPLPSEDTSSRLEPLLVFSEAAVLAEPDDSGRVTGESEPRPVPGWWHGAVGEHGRGRVALFGEAAMFRVLTTDAGLPPDVQNHRLLRNLIRWLSRR